jgi:beta propeller repeat protein
MRGYRAGQVRRDRESWVKGSPGGRRGYHPLRILIPLCILLIMGGFVSPGMAYLSIIEPTQNTFRIGEWVNFTGLNTESDTTYLFLVGQDLDSAGTMLTNTSRFAREGWLDSAPVGDGRAWRFSWDTSAPGVNLKEGAYAVYAVVRPADLNSVETKTYRTRRVEFQGRLIPLTPTTIATPTPVPTWTQPPAGTQVQVSRNPTDDIPGKFDGRYVVYESRKGTGDSDIFLYDIVTGNTTAVATGPVIQQTPSISGNWVAYSAFEKKGWEQSDSDIYLYRVNTGDTTRITLPGDQLNPRVSGNLVVWEDVPVGQRSAHLMLQDLTTGTRIQIPSPSSAYRPDISGRRVIWIDRLDSPAIFLYDVLEGTVERITNRTGIQGYPQIDRNRVTWADMRGDDFDIIVLDVVTGQETRVTEGDRNQFTPSVSGDRVAWIDYRNDHFDVYVYNLATRSLTGINNDRPKQSDVQVGGCILAWADDRNGSFDVYYQELEGCTPLAAAEVVMLPAEETMAATQTTVPAFPTAPATVPTLRTTIPITTAPVPATTSPPGFDAGVAVIAGIGIIVLSGWSMGMKRDR